MSTLNCTAKFLRNGKYKGHVFLLSEEKDSKAYSIVENLSIQYGKKIGVWLPERSKYSWLTINTEDSKFSFHENVFYELSLKFKKRRYVHQGEHKQKVVVLIDKAVKIEPEYEEEDLIL